MSWDIKVRKVDNGYIMEWEDDDEEGKPSKHEQVILENETEDSELEAMKDLLCEIKEHFGISYSKHNQKNLTIEIEEMKE